VRALVILVDRPCNVLYIAVGMQTCSREFVYIFRWILEDWLLGIITNTQQSWWKISV